MATTKKVEFTCQKCGACCELLMPKCRNYDAEKRLCKDFDNRPWMCVQQKLLGDDFAIQTCVLLRKLRKWGKRVDRERLDSVMIALFQTFFGASKEQIASIKNKISKEEQERITKDMKDYSSALVKEVSDGSI